ncbi:VOC family protein [Nocardia thailandica]|uniref:VOC family protein n=1 Tax=Nocardia thailandica TaxID=257275 RepID=A0ABW6PVZ3_9NOCA
MRVSSFYPVLGTTDLAACRDFYTHWFGFEITFEADWYISLRRPGDDGGPGHELALLDPAHPTVPPGYREPVRGLLLNIEVADVDAEWERLVVRGGLTPELAIRSEDFGQRHFIVADPAGVLVDVITEIPPSPEFAARFAD